MYTNPYNIVLTLINLLDRNSQQINEVVRTFQSKRKLMVLPGMRKVIPADAFPVFEIEARDVPNQWATTRAQRPRYQFQCTLTVGVDNEKFGLQYICTLSTIIAEIMTNPANLQLPVIGETKWDFQSGLVQTYILDSLVESANYSAAKEGAIRKSEFSWFATIHEPYPESFWRINSSNTPTVLKPKVVTIRP